MTSSKSAFCEAVRIAQRQLGVRPKYPPKPELLKVSVAFGRPVGIASGDPELDALQGVVGGAGWWG